MDDDSNSIFMFEGSEPGLTRLQVPSEAARRALAILKGQQLPAELNYTIPDSAWNNPVLKEALTSAYERHLQELGGISSSGREPLIMRASLVYDLYDQESDVEGNRNPDAMAGIATCMWSYVPRAGESTGDVDSPSSVIRVTRLDATAQGPNTVTGGDAYLYTEQEAFRYMDAKWALERWKYDDEADRSSTGGFVGGTGHTQISSASPPPTGAWKTALTAFKRLTQMFSVRGPSGSPSSAKTQRSGTRRFLSSIFPNRPKGQSHLNEGTRVDPTHESITSTAGPASVGPAPRAGLRSSLFPSPEHSRFSEVSGLTSPYDPYDSQNTDIVISPTTPTERRFDF